MRKRSHAHLKHTRYSKGYICLKSNLKEFYLTDWLADWHHCFGSQEVLLTHACTPRKMHTRLHAVEESLNELGADLLFINNLSSSMPFSTFDMQRSFSRLSFRHKNCQLKSDGLMLVLVCYLLNIQIHIKTNFVEQKVNSCKRLIKAWTSHACNCFSLPAAPPAFKVFQPLKWATGESSWEVSLI